MTIAIIGALLVGALLFLQYRTRQQGHPRVTPTPPSSAPPATGTRATGSRTSAAKDILSGLVRVSGLAADPLQISHLEDKIFTAIFETGFVMKRDKILKLGNTVVVDTSPEAYEKLFPIERAVVDELTTLLEERAQAEGWTVLGTLKLTLRPDPALTADQVRARAVVDEDTPTTRTSSRRTTTRRDANANAKSETPLVRLHLVGAHHQAAREAGHGQRAAQSFTLPTDGSQIVIGRSTASDWTPTTDINSLVSRTHIKANLQQFNHDGQTVWGVRVIDQDTPHGTWTNDVRTTGAAFVAHGGTLRLGPRLTLRVTVGTSTDEDTPHTSPNEDTPRTIRD